MVLEIWENEEVYQNIVNNSACQEELWRLKTNSRLVRWNLLNSTKSTFRYHLKKKT